MAPCPRKHNTASPRPPTGLERARQPQSTYNKCKATDLIPRNVRPGGLASKVDRHQVNANRGGRSKDPSLALTDRGLVIELNAWLEFILHVPMCQMRCPPALRLQWHAQTGLDA